MHMYAQPLAEEMILHENHMGNRSAILGLENKVPSGSQAHGSQPSLLIPRNLTYYRQKQMHSGKQESVQNQEIQETFPPADTRAKVFPPRSAGSCSVFRVNSS